MAQQLVLIVDDEAVIRSNLGRMLQKIGLDIVTASDGEEALAVFKETKPDLVLRSVRRRSTSCWA